MASPSQFRETAPGRLELREGGGCPSLLGFPFFLAGIFLLLSGSGVIPLKSESPAPAWMPLLLLAMGIVFFGVGAVLLFGRRWITIDTSQGTVSRQYGLLVPMRREERRLTEFTAVVLEFKAGDSDSSDSYPLELRAATGKNFPLHGSAQFAESWQQAEYLANYLNLSLADNTSGSERVLSPQRSGESLQTRLRSDPSLANRATPPSALRSQVESSRGSATIVIPGPRHLIGALAAALISAGFIGILSPAFLRFFRQTLTPEFVQFGFFGFMILCFGVLPALGAVNFILAAVRARTAVTASSQEVVIETQGAWRRTITRIASRDLLSVDTPPAPPSKYIPTRGLLLKSRQGIYILGAGLPLDELCYLRAVLLRALAP